MRFVKTERDIPALIGSGSLFRHWGTINDNSLDWDFDSGDRG